MERASKAKQKAILLYGELGRKRDELLLSRRRGLEGQKKKEKVTLTEGVLSGWNQKIPESEGEERQTVVGTEISAGIKP